MVVYWDSVLLFNGVCDYLLLLCTLRLAGREPNRRYLIAASALGAVYALLTCLVPMLLIFALPVLAAMGWIAFHQNGAVGRLTLLFALLSCLLAGLLLLLGSLRTSVSSLAGRVSFGDLPWHIFGAGFALVYLFLCVFFRGGLQKTGKELVKATFYHHGRRITLRLLCDNGNLLRDANGACVPIVEEKALASFALAADEFQEMPCQTVGGDMILRTFVCERMSIGKEVRENCLVAVTPQEIGGIYAGLWCETSVEENCCVVS